eukprot:gene2972-3542_t
MSGRYAALWASLSGGVISAHGADLALGKCAPGASSQVFLYNATLKEVVNTPGKGGTCFDGDGGQVAPDVVVDLWKCKGPGDKQGNQYFIRQGQLIVSAQTTDMCVTSDSDKLGAGLRFQPCGGMWQSLQQWHWDPPGSIALASDPSLCLDSAQAPLPVYTEVHVDPKAPSYNFYGVGAVSGGGGDSRLLSEYPE